MKALGPLLNFLVAIGIGCFIYYLALRQMLRRLWK